MTHLLDTHAWIQRALGEPLPPLVEKTLTGHADSLALADVSLWEAAKLVELGKLELSVPLAEFFRLALTPELTVLRGKFRGVHTTRLAAHACRRNPGPRG